MIGWEEFGYRVGALALFGMFILILVLILGKLALSLYDGARWLYGHLRSRPPFSP